LGHLIKVTTDLVKLSIVDLPISTEVIYQKNDFIARQFVAFLRMIPSHIY
jgi:hypothetical protein